MDERIGKLAELLGFLVKAALVSDDAESLRYRRQALATRAEWLRFGPAEDWKIEGAWTRAVREAKVPDLRPREGRVSLGLPAACPISVAALIAPGFDIDRTVARIAESAATG